MTSEVFAAVLDSLLHRLVHDSGLKLTFTLKPHTPNSIPVLTVEFFGPDVPVLLARNAELLLAIEHIAVKVLRLEPEHHDLISLDAAGFKLSRERALGRSAQRAVQQVRASGRPFHFPPMNSRERRLLHLALAPHGLPTLSEGEGPLRHIVLRPPPR